MDAIEAELESELAAIGNVVAHYDAADLGDGLPSDNDLLDTNPLASLVGYEEFAATRARERAAESLAEAESILLDDKAVSDAEDVSMDKVDSPTSDCTVGGSVSGDSTTAIDNNSTSDSVPLSPTSTGTQSPHRVDNSNDILSGAPNPTPLPIQLPLQHEYENELRAIQEEAAAAERVRVERFRQARELREAALLKERRLLETQTLAAIEIQALVRRAIGRRRRRQMRRAQVEARLISVRQRVFLRRATSAMQSHSIQLRREDFRTSRMMLHVHLLDCREKCNAAATIIQSFARRQLMMRSMTQTLTAVVVLQRFLRCKRAQGHFHRLRVSAIVVQRYIRGRAAEKVLARKMIEDGVIYIQKFARALIACRRYQLTREAVVTLQRCYRGRRAREQLSVIKGISFAFDEDDEMSIDSIDSIGNLVDDIGQLTVDLEPDEAFLEGRRSPRRKRVEADGAVASSEATQTGTSELVPSVTPSAPIQPTPTSNQPTGVNEGRWGGRVARAFIERGQHMLPGTRRRKNNNRSRREGPSRWK